MIRRFPCLASALALMAAVLPAAAPAAEPAPALRVLRPPMAAAPLRPQSGIVVLDAAKAQQRPARPAMRPGPVTASPAPDLSLADKGKLIGQLQALKVPGGMTALTGVATKAVLTPTAPYLHGQASVVLLADGDVWGPQVDGSYYAGSSAWVMQDIRSHLVINFKPFVTGKMMIVVFHTLWTTPGSVFYVNGQDVEPTPDGTMVTVLTPANTNPLWLTLEPVRENAQAAITSVEILVAQ